MAHRYANFDDAFDHIKLTWTSVYLTHAALSQISGMVIFYANGGNWQGALYQCASGFSYIEELFEWLLDANETSWQRSAYMECLFYAGQEPETTELTWQAICEAWIKDDFAGRAMTISVIDRMRQILWNEEYFINWAARPEDAEF